MVTDSPGVRVPPPVWFAATFALGLGLHQVIPLGFEPEFRAKYGAMLMLVTSLVLVGSAVREMRRVKTGLRPDQPATAMVRQGPYRYTRNPMYLGLVIAYTGLSLNFGLLWPILLLPVLVWVVQSLVIRAEEAYLQRRFGDEYAEYRRSVRRWL